MDLWNEWETQILVVLSLALQVVLLLFAGIRRREASAVPRLFLWLAYQLADSTAIYAVGQLSFSSAPREHQLVAFWAPFLLLHLGGPDNITAYALEDNKLWKRHFITLVVQVLGTVYILYKHIAGSGSLVVLAAVLMLVVGVLKYGEWTWALRRANFSSIRSSLKGELHNKHQWYQGYLGDQDVDDEFLLQRSHSLFHICKRGIVDSVIAEDSIIRDTEMIEDLKKDDEKFWTVMEMELSLMYDILYTKAAVIHTLVGYCIRVVSPLAIVVSLLLFQFSGKDGHSRVDVVITYVLLGGAFLLETASLLSALGSSWTLAFLCATRWTWLRHAALCAGRWHRLRRAVVYLHRRLVKIMTGSSSLYRSRRWSGTIGQYNMLHFCTAQIDPTIRRLGRLANMLGLSEWWDRKLYSWNVVIAEEVKERTHSMVTRAPDRDLNTMGLLRGKWGALAMNKHHGLAEKLKEWHGVDFHESIISWHIATDLFLNRSPRAKAEDAVDRVDAIWALSNYMMFLLVNRPDMLPGLPQNWLYEKTCNNLDQQCKKLPERLINYEGRSNVCAVLKKLFRPRDYLKSSRLEETKDQLVGIIIKHVELNPDFSEVPRLSYAFAIARELVLWENDPVDVLLDMWTDFLAYAANRCNRESHAKMLSSGGEFTTVIWLMIEHLYKTKQKEGP